MADIELSSDFVDSLTIDDIEALEDETGIPIDRLFSGEAEVSKATMMRAVVFILKRRNDPEFTMAQAGKVPLGEIDRLLKVAGGAAPDPLPDSGT